MSIREFAYFDKQKVTDFVSSLEKGLPKSRRELRVETKSKVSGSIGVPFANVGASKGGGRTEVEEVKSETDASMFERLHELLVISSSIQSLSKATVGSLVEEEVTVDLSGKDVLADVMEGIMPVFAAQAPAPVAAKNFEAVKALIENLATKGVTVIMLPRSTSSTRIVANLYPDRLRVTRSELIGDYVALCRIQRILRQGESLDLFNIISGLKMPPQVLDQMLVGFAKPTDPNWSLNLSREKFELGYPGVVATVVALYR